MIGKCKRCNKIISLTFPLHFCIKKGDVVYYHHKNKDTYPAIVLQIKGVKIKIKYNGLKKDVIAWVKNSSIELQD